MVGRPKGYPRTGGRVAGSTNKVTSDIKALAQNYGEKALATLVNVMESDQTPPAARVAAARELLDRGYGKSPQPIPVSDTTDKTSLLAAIADRLPN